MVGLGCVENQGKSLPRSAWPSPSPSPGFPDSHLPTQFQPLTQRTCFCLSLLESLPSVGFQDLLPLVHLITLGAHNPPL